MNKVVGIFFIIYLVDSKISCIFVKHLKHTAMKAHYMNIEEALKVERPTDKIVRILNNKFAITKSRFTDGTFDAPHIAFIEKGTTVWSFGTNYKRYIVKYAEQHSITYHGWWLDHSKSGMPNHYVTKISDHRREKQLCRKLIKLLAK